jgi:hypothetical protein
MYQFRSQRTSLHLFDVAGRCNWHKGMHLDELRFALMMSAVVVQQDLKAG